MDILIPILVSGCITGLVALAFQLATNATGGVVDFATGQYVVGAGITFAAVAASGLPVPLAIGSAVFVAVAMALVSEVAVLRPLGRRGSGPTHFEPVVATVALLFIWEQITRLVWGDEARRGPSWLPTGEWSVSGMSVSVHQLTVVAVTVAIFVVTVAGLRHSHLGRSLRALGDNARGAALVGFRVGRSRAAAVAGAGIICGVAGALASPLSGLAAFGGTTFLLGGFVALFIGGHANPWGPLLGGLVLEAAKVLVSRYVGAGAQDYLVLVAALSIFALRPQGILSGAKVRAS